jgi:uncharacterized protein with HEPN domain
MRRDRERILDMLEMCDLLLAHAASPEQLEASPVVQGAAQRWIEVLGEAASHISDDLKQAHPEVAWREIVGIRVILAHAYFHIDHDIIGDLIARDIPRLRTQLQTILESLEPEPS